MRVHGKYKTPAEGVRSVSQKPHTSDSAPPALDEKFRQLSPLQKLLLARQLGYDSFSSMLAASTVVTLSDGSRWWVTADQYGGRMAWNLCQLEFSQSAGPEASADAPVPDRLAR
jgi:hypothetical protein